MTKTKMKPAKTKKVKHKMKLPVVRKSKEKKDVGDFPLSHYSYSSLAKFSTNPILFKVKYINGDHIESAHSASMVLGNAFHKALEVYYGGSDDQPITGEEDAIETGLKTGMQFIEKYPEGFIHFNTQIPSKEKMYEKFAFIFNEYVKDRPYGGGNEEILSIEEALEEQVEVEWHGETIALPIPLKCYLDKVVRHDGKLKIVDYKTTSKFSDPEKLDARKILQAVQYYFAVYAKYGESPHSMIFDEVKHVKNRDGSAQLQSYELVYEDNEQFFDFYLRYYDDVTRAINGESVFVPNIDAFFDNEIATVAYIHRLDVEEERAKHMKAQKVSNITDLLQKKIQNAGNLKKFLKTAEKKFVTAKSINYDKMTKEEKITTKLMEYGIMLEYDSTIHGASVDLYRYTPTIGLKMSRLKSYTSDVEQVLGTSGVRILAPIPNTEYVGFEVPRKQRNFPKLPATRGMKEIAIGEQIDGTSRLYDIRDAPHILVAGASGSGKSVFLGSLIQQLQRGNTALHLFDPKIVELAQYESIANEYKTDPTDIAQSLQRLIKTMNNRYKKMANAGVRKIEDYNGSMAYKFAIIDEFGDLTAGNSSMAHEITNSILKLAQKGRAAGIHLIVATQSPRSNIITGTIKANFTTKVVFKTAKLIDSQVVIDEGGAEKLLGKGDMLFVSDAGNERLQGYQS